MSLFVRIYSVEKRGNSPAENQDAFHPIKLPRRVLSPKRGEFQSELPFVAAVADGATEGVLSEVWSRILARHTILLHRSEKKIFVERVKKVWDRFKRFKMRGGRAITKLPNWLEEPSLEQGAFSTLISANFSSDSDWKAIAIGDSCIFQIRDDSLLIAWPIENSDGFTSRPYLVGSEQIEDAFDDGRINAVEGTRNFEDRFFIMSDAFACWFLRQHEQGKKPWRVLMNLGTEDQESEFDSLVEDLRDSKELKNDDIALICIESI